MCSLRRLLRAIVPAPFRGRAARLARRAQSPARGDREARFASLARSTPLAAIDVEGLRFVVSTADRNVGRRLFVERSRPELHHLRRALERTGADLGAESGEFIDVGANIGTTAVAAARTHGFGRVLALEPDPLNHELLQVNAILNGVADRLTALRVAASDARGEGQLRRSDGNFASHRIVSAVSPRTISVPLVTLDELAEEGCFDPTRVRMLWIDVEGHEGAVLRGASCLLERTIPFVAEFCPTRLGPDGLDHFLKAVAGYGDVVDLERGETVPIERVAALIDRYSARAKLKTDVLVLPRGHD